MRGTGVRRPAVGILTDREEYRGYILLPLKLTGKVMIYFHGEAIDTALSMDQARRTVDSWHNAR